MKQVEFKIGDKVTRKKYNNDIEFEIYKIENDVIYLKGTSIRLIADCSINDIQKSKNVKKKVSNRHIKRLDTSKYFYIPGKILHIDSDQNYINQCLELYKDNGLYVKHHCVDEEKMPELISKINNFSEYDVIIITGHDAYYKNKKNSKNYLNSEYFISAIKKIRKTNKNVIIIGGACQSDYKGLINSGSTYASSPSHINIHALDPAIVAVDICLTLNDESINLEKTIEKTHYGSKGIGGIKTFGTMKLGFPRKADDNEY